jgi:hypothetical protein
MKRARQPGDEVRVNPKRLSRLPCPYQRGGLRLTYSP